MVSVKYDLSVKNRRAAIIRFGVEDDFFKVLQSTPADNGETQQPVVVCSSNRVYVADVDDWADAVQKASSIVRSWQERFTGKAWTNANCELKF